MQLGAWEARLLFAAQGKADCGLSQKDLRFERINYGRHQVVQSRAEG